MYEVPEETLNAVLKYLGSRPYVEVAPLVALIKQTKPVQKQDDAKKAK